jgi:hypothetical protein
MDPTSIFNVDAGGLANLSTRSFRLNFLNPDSSAVTS